LIRLGVRRNIWLAYFLSFAFHSWFWMGNWIFYYLTFGGYGAVSVLDAGAIMAGLLFEIPTGAFADLVGKKKTLMIAFLVSGIGAILMGYATSFWMLAFALWVMVCGGGAFYSGTMEALLYDSLKSLKKEKDFDKHIGKLNAFRLWSMAACGIIGGFAYSINAGLPYILNGILLLIGFVACFWLTEPAVDTEKYSWNSFFKQNTLGIKTLFANTYMKKLTVFLMTTGGLAIVIYNVLDDLLAVEYGFTPLSVSILFSVACVIAGIASYYVPHLKIKFDERKTLMISMIIIAIALIVSPIIGMVTSGVLLMIRVIMEVLYDNAASSLINKNTSSEVRATTLSSLSLLRSIPYGLGGSFVGVLVILSGGAKMFAMYFGIVLTLSVIVLGLRIPKKVN